ncbi:helicase HerA domain-containing protein [Planktotalea arctica]|uniref:helicase HerA domain-containing protein n=1 Tax=Planktotalea arctica TaxID=1481893 RepID=UPI00321A3822
MSAGRHLFIGASGSGKTTLITHSLRGMKRVVIFDPEGEYGGMRGYKTVHHADDILEAVARNVSGFKVRYEPADASALPEALNSCAEACMIIQASHLNKTNAPTLQLIVDEMAVSFPLRGKTEHRRFFNDICLRGRRRHIQVIGAAQGMAQIGTEFRRNLSTVKVLRQQGKADFQAAIDATMLSRDQIGALQQFEYWDCDMERGTKVKKKVPKPK